MTGPSRTMIETWAKQAEEVRRSRRVDPEESALAARAVAALLLFRDADGNWSAKAQAHGVTKHVAAHPELSTVLEQAEQFIAQQLAP